VGEALTETIQPLLSVQGLQLVPSAGKVKGAKYWHRAYSVDDRFCFIYCPNVISETNFRSTISPLKSIKHGLGSFKKFKVRKHNI